MAVPASLLAPATFSLWAPQNHACLLCQTCRSQVGISNQCFNVLWRVRCKVSRPAINHGVEQGAFHSGIPGSSQALNDIVPARRSSLDAIQGLAPPLQTDFAQHGFRNRFGNTGQLVVEGVKGKQSLTFFRCSKQGAEKPVWVVLRAPADHRPIDLLLV